MKTLSVTGKASIFVKPDLVKFNMRVSNLYDTYEETVEKSSEITVKMKDFIQDCGFNRKNLKTDSLSVRPEYKYKEEDGVSESILVGYRYYYDSFIKFDNDNEILGKLIYDLTNSELDVDFNVKYEIKDDEKYQDEVLEKAIEIAKSKANIIANTSKVKLLDITNIDYSFNKIDLFYEDRSIRSSYSIDIDADDIEISDEITITWNIE